MSDSGDDSLSSSSGGQQSSGGGGAYPVPIEADDGLDDAAADENAPPPVGGAGPPQEVDDDEDEAGDDDDEPGDDDAAGDDGSGDENEADAEDDETDNQMSDDQKRGTQPRAASGDSKSNAAAAAAAAASLSSLSPSMFSTLASSVGVASSSSSGRVPNGWPTELEISQFPYLSKIHTDKLTVKYIGKGNHASDVGTVRANHLTPKHAAIYYFEAIVIEGRTSGTIAIGFAPGSFALNRAVGHTIESYSYGASGRKYNGLARGDPYAAAFGTVPPAPAPSAGAAANASAAVVTAAAAAAAAAVAAPQPLVSGGAARTAPNTPPAPARSANELPAATNNAAPASASSSAASAAAAAAAGGGAAARATSGGDVIGAGINWYTRELFFTRNGVYLGTAFTSIPTVPLYPIISMHTAGEAVKCNFGNDKFRFDIDKYRAEEKSRYDEIIARGAPVPFVNGNGAAVATATLVPSTPIDKRRVHALVRSYLLHSGYEQTFHALEAYSVPPPAAGASKTANGANGHLDVKHSNGSSAYPTNGHHATANGHGSQHAAAAAATDPVVASLAVRKQIRQHIISGDIRRAITLIDQQSGNGVSIKLINARRRDVVFQLQCLRFVQLIQLKHMNEAIQFARDILSPYNERAFQSTLHSVLSLMAYVDADRSPVAYLLQPNHRQKIADAVNSAVLELLTTPQGVSVAIASGKSDSVPPAAPATNSALERLLKHLLCTHAIVEHETNGLTPPFTL